MAYIQGPPPGLDTLSIDELRSISEVVELLSGFIPDLPLRAELRKRVDFANLLEPFRQISSEERFFGRGEDVILIDQYLAGVGQ